jgi:hypothetical protein
MRPSLPVTRTATLAAVLALAVPAAAQAAPKDYRGRTIYATTADATLVSVAAARPGTILSRRALTGIPAGVSLKGIDFRPATGDLYGLGSDAVVYRVNPRTAIAVAEGPAFVSGLSGTLFGLDFNPTVDRIRITSDERQNLRADPDASTALVDGPINPGDPDVVAVAYTNSFVNAVRPTATVLFGVDTASDTLQTLNPPNAGTLTEGKPLGVDVGPETSFDIAGKRNVAYLATAGATGGSTLHTVDLATGTATLVGRIGDGTVTVTGLAAQQDIQRSDPAWVAAAHGGR